MVNTHHASDARFSFSSSSRAFSFSSSSSSSTPANVGTSRSSTVPVAAHHRRTPPPRQQTATSPVGEHATDTTECRVPSKRLRAASSVFVGYFLCLRVSLPHSQSSRSESEDEETPDESDDEDAWSCSSSSVGSVGGGVRSWSWTCSPRPRGTAPPSPSRSRPPRRFTSPFFCFVVSPLVWNDALPRRQSYRLWVSSWAVPAVLEEVSNALALSYASAINRNFSGSPPLSG